MNDVMLGACRELQYAGLEMLSLPCERPPNPLCQRLALSGTVQAREMSLFSSASRYG